jgi:1-acyl-sn-glycerol-3-phosphate acyltransferase
MEKIYYYSDELNDDFAQENINPITIDSNYKYVHTNFLWKLTSFIVYRIIAIPIAYVYSKIAYGLEFKNKKALKECKDTGYFIYGNHTQKVLDTFIPTLGNFPRKCHIVAHPDNVSIPVLGTFNKMMGGFPIPSDIKTTKNFLDAMETFIKNKNVISIYPEAHVWPYYSKIRNFVSTSFKYPVKLDKPVYSFTTTYKNRKFRKPKITVYIDGPFYPNKELNIKNAQEELRNRVYNQMCIRAKESNVEYIKYLKIENKGEAKND